MKINFYGLLCFAIDGGDDIAKGSQRLDNVTLHNRGCTSDDISETHFIFY